MNGVTNDPRKAYIFKTGYAEISVLAPTKVAGQGVAYLHTEVEVQLRFVHLAYLEYPQGRYAQRFGQEYWQPLQWFFHPEMTLMNSSSLHS